MKSSRPIHSLLSHIAIFALLFAASTNAFAQAQASFDAELARAQQLIQANKLPEALPILEKLYAAKPDHPALLEMLAYSLSVSAVPEKDKDKRKKMLIRARQLAERAKRAGNNSQLVEAMIDQIPADGNLPEMTPRTPAEEAMMEGEAAFVRGEMERALEHYERAAKLNPKMYEAPLFIGDVYFKMGKIDKAGESYARAIAINPDLDTAYRYWGNVLMEAGKLKEAKEKLIEAVVAQPYIRAPWEFLAKWGERSNVELGHPRVEPSGSMSVEKDNTTIAIDPKSAGKADGSGLWMLYHTRRSQWIKEKFAKEFPGEKEYRHSLREEADALGLVANLAAESLKDGRLKEKDLDVSIANLLRIHKAGLLEAFILLARADDGIARDYPEYRKTNRDRLRQYMNEFVTAPR